tara:strand:+ start:7941 stop:8744 length:804 start_codon:yes stop_codon:yes gene_type:complete
MNRKSNPTVIIVNTGLATEESSKAFYDVLSDKVAHIHKDPDLDWKSALAYHDIEKSGIDADFIEEGTEVILLQDNVVLHPNCTPILQQPIPEKGSIKPFMLEHTDNYGFEVAEKIKEKNDALAPIREAIEENNYSYLNCPIAWWEEEPKIFTGLVAFRYGDTKELYQPDTEYTTSDEFYTNEFKGVIWPTIKGSVVDIQNDNGKEEQWIERIIPEFPQEFNPRDKFATSIEYSEEMHKPFFSLEEGLNQHVSMVFFDKYERVQNMPL